MAAASPLSEEIIELRKKLKDYKPGDASNASKSPDRINFPQNLYIGLFGKTGCGKTSLINSIKYAAHGRLRRSMWVQVAGQEKAGGHTMRRILANIINHIFVIDNRGLDRLHTYEEIEELSAGLDGKRSCSQIVQWQGDEGTNDDAHPISCVVLVFSPLHDLEDSTTGLTEMIDFLHMHQGRYPLAVITHVDVTEEARVEKICTILHTCGVRDIFKVANPTREKTRLEERYQLILLNLMNKCIIEGDETLICKYNRRKGRQLKDDIMMLECAGTGAQRHLAAEVEDSFAALERERMAALKRERMAALERERMAVLERERSEALERERMAVLERERSEAQGREREAALEDTIMRMKSQDMQNMDFDEKLKTVAKSFVNPNEVDDLGKALGFKPDDITPFIATNSKGANVSSWGTLSMLRDWRRKQTKATECEVLKGALREAGQIRLADELFGTS